ncbi:MAG: LPS export ABC transporter periplasmic protein LptC [Sedimentisphaerales bacterium]|nr:LPS export ABC transporter periplasmic protein LptC [Sedimentisphaerales bacterium]
MTACWLVAALYCAVLCWNDDRFAGVPDGARLDMSELTVTGNETGRFSLRRLDARAGYQPAFYLAWENLQGANGQLGLFKTALHKTIIIEDLEAKFYHYPDAEADANGSAVAGPARHGGSFLSPAAYGASRLLESDSGDNGADVAYPTSPMQMLRVLEYELGGDLEGIEVESSLLIDVSNATKLVIRDLDYGFFEGQTLVLGITCSRATVAKAGAELLLQGRVAITAAGNSKLVSSRVHWDLKRNIFSVPGTFMINRNGTLVRGRGMQCDHRLQSLGANAASSEKGERKWVKRASF